MISRWKARRRAKNLLGAILFEDDSIARRAIRAYLSKRGLGALSDALREVDDHPDAQADLGEVKTGEALLVEFYDGTPVFGDLLLDELDEPRIIATEREVQIESRQHGRLVTVCVPREHCRITFVAPNGGQE